MQGTFLEMAETFAPLQDNRVVMFDNPGQGLSVDTSPDPLTIESMATTIMGLLRAAEIATNDSKPALLGW